MKIKLEIFEGPLDLLLYLVKKDHLNIYDIPIAQVTEQYIQYLELMRLLDLNIASEFLVMAATLIHIKSKMLLPSQDSPVEAEEEEIDPRLDLIRQLLEYKKFKEAAEELKRREIIQQKVFARPPTSSEFNSSEEEAFFEASLFDLISAFSTALSGKVSREIFYEVIKDEFTVEGKIHDMLHMLLATAQINASRLFASAKNKLEVVAIFLAILELIRLKEIILRQKQLFGDIIILRNSERISPFVNPVRKDGVLT